MGTRNPLNEASDAIHKGEREEAHQILRQLVDHEPNNAQAWFMYFSVLQNPAEKYDALFRAAQLDPKNERYREKLKKYRASGEYRGYRAKLTEAAAHEEEQNRTARRREEQSAGARSLLSRIFRSIGQVFKPRASKTD
jgi:thioredoxin-like negative regulator of GroEL